MVVVDGAAEAQGEAVGYGVVAHAGALEADAAHEVRHAAHIVGAARDDDVGLAGCDGLHGEVDGLEAGRAGAVDGHGGDVLGQAGLQHGAACRVAGLVGLQHVAHDDLVDVAGLDARAFDGGADGDGAEFRGGQVLERAAEPPDGRPRSADDDYVLHPLAPGG